MSPAEAKQRIWAALRTTLSNDRHDLAASYIYGEDDTDPFDAETITRLEQAADDILRQLDRKLRLYDACNRAKRNQGV